MRLRRARPRDHHLYIDLKDVEKTNFMIFRHYIINGTDLGIVKLKGITHGVFDVYHGSTVKARLIGKAELIRYLEKNYESRRKNPEITSAKT